MFKFVGKKNKKMTTHITTTTWKGKMQFESTNPSGETFLISLSLALGLSKMASDTVSVDTLFLDEGFGTLDESTLETALNTLSSLQTEGKLIGIISHVAALKERIHTQIKVSPLRYGQSKIEGPGCSKVQPAP